MISTSYIPIDDLNRYKMPYTLTNVYNYKVNNCVYNCDLTSFRSASAFKTHYLNPLKNT